MEGLYYRALSLYLEDAELLKSRLRQWFTHYQPEWAGVTADFFTAIKEALESAKEKTLLEGFKNALHSKKSLMVKITPSCDEAYISGHRIGNE